MTRTLTHILVPTDFSAASDGALEYALMLAERLGASVHLLHVLENPYLTSGDGGTDVYLPLPSDVCAALLDDARRRLRECLIRIQSAPADATIEQHARPTADAITHYASEHAADLIVLGTRRHGAATDAPTGSITERVLRSAPCPILAICQPTSSTTSGAAA
jgi:nucleotide-binding universal stress UspA family protein